MAKTPEKLVEYLLRKSRSFKTKGSASHRIIQSSLTKQSLELASQSELNLNLSKQNNVFKVCQWCFCFWTKGMYSFKIEPQKRPSKFIRSLLNKNIETLTEMQLKQREKYTERCNRMVLKCNVCNKETKVSLQKPDPITVNANSNDQNSLPIKPKKKKKKKDSYAGLKSEAIMKYKPPSIDKQPTLFSPENTNSSNNPKNTSIVFNIQNKPIKKKKNKLNVGKLKNILGKEKKSNVPTVSNKKNNSLLSAFLTSL